MGKADLKTKCLACVPAPLDFVLPGRFPRKFAMAASWLSLAEIVLLVVALSSAVWATQHRTESVALGNSGNATVTTDATYGLRTYALTRTIAGDTIHVDTERGLVASLLGVGALASTSGAVLGTLVAALVCACVATLACFWHGWARWGASGDRCTFVAASGAAFCALLVALLAFVMYAAAVPRDMGFALAWGAWVCLAACVLELAILVLVLLDKPLGLVRYEKGRGIVAEERTSSVVASSAPAPVRMSTTTTTVARAPQPQQQQQQQQQQQPKPKPQQPPPRQQLQQQQQQREVRLKALFDCAADAEGDLSFRAGDLLVLVSEEPGNGWLTGRNPAGAVGILPANYVSRM